MPRSRRAVLSSSLPKATREETHAEDHYFAKLFASGTPIVVDLVDGEVLRGALAWFDRNAVALWVGHSATEVVIPKSSVVAVTKAEATTSPRAVGRPR